MEGISRENLTIINNNIKGLKLKENIKDMQNQCKRGVKHVETRFLDAI